MSRAVNIVGSDAWTSTGEAAQPAAPESRQVREMPVRAPVEYRFEREPDTRKSEWNSSLLLVQEACEAIKASEDRVQALESELEALHAKHRDTVMQMKARLQSAEEEIKAANAQANALEARAVEAEAWLARLNQAIMNGFGGIARAPRRS
jgi:septal ring factor EnvC (AmiA/AmiB activator)